VATVRRNSERGATILASEACVLSKRRTGEAVACLSAGEKGRMERGMGRRPVAFERAQARGRWKKGEVGQGVLGRGCHAARGGRGAWPRPAGGAPTVSQPTAARPWRALFRAGTRGVGSLTRETKPVVGEGGRRERSGTCVGRAGKDRGGLSLDEQ
jgi:hypothetical protein